MMTSKLSWPKEKFLPERIFLDASHTHASGKNSGIERVVRSIMAECEQWCHPSGVPTPKLVTHHQGTFYLVESTTKNHFTRIASIESNVRNQLPKWYLSFASKISELSRSSRFRKWFYPEAGHLGVFKLPHSIYDSILRKSLSYHSLPVSPTEKDLFLLPDAYWTRRGVWQAAAHARNSGATIATVIYDLIPLTHPQYVGTKRMEGFRRYLNHAVENSDLIVAISQTVRDEVREYIKNHFSDFKRLPTSVEHFTLGAELSLVNGAIRPAVKELFGVKLAENSQAKPYLMVATFDPRKNHHYLLDAFDLLWKQRSDLQLCLIGRVGSLCEDVIHRIRSHPAWNKQLFAFFDIKDAELQHCYQNCRGVIFPSIVEGFGLPIVESLWFGKRTFASDTPIHREVGKNDCVYFDLEDPTDLANEIEKWELIAGDNNKLPTRRPTNWEESSRQLIAHCLKSHAMIRSNGTPSLNKAA